MSPLLRTRLRRRRTAERPPRRAHAAPVSPGIRTLATLLLVGALASGCGTPADEPRDADRQRVSSSDADADTAELWDDMRDIANGPVVRTRAPSGLQPTAGFNRADVRALADRALDVLRRSTEPRLSRLTATEAVDEVYAGQYPQTAFQFKQEAIDRTPGLDWQWSAASRYPRPSGVPTEPRFLKITGKVSSGQDGIDDGTTAKFLTVTIQAHIAQTVESDRYGRVPIVVRRTVRASGFRPRGGPDWWPSVSVGTVPFGNTACGLYRGALLDPITDGGDLRRDVESLKISLDSPTLIPEQSISASDADKLRDAVRDECG